MAQLSNDRTYVTVERGDTLSEIALDFKSYSNNATYQQLAAINDIPNPDLIYVGQKIKLTNSTGGQKDKDDPVKVTKKQFGEMADDNNKLFISWKFSANNVENYRVIWQYYTADKEWFVGSDATTTNKYSIYDVPALAKVVRVKVRPISKKYKDGDTEKYYWDGEWTSWFKHDIVNAPGTPNGLSADIDDSLKLTAEVSNLDSNTTIVEFDVVKDNSTSIKIEKVDARTGYASYTCVVTAGGTYKVRCRAYGNGVYSDWSNYTPNIITVPSVPGKLTKCEASSDTSIHIEWAAVSTATSYDIEYATAEANFDTSDDTTTISDVTVTSWDLNDISSGQTYFFRVRASNAKGDSGWSEVSSTVIGTGPAAPTTWSSTTTAIIGDPLTLNWVHNSKDGSSQTYAILDLYFTGAIELTDTFAASLIDPVIGTMAEYTIDSANKKISYKITNSTNEEEKDLTSSCVVDTSLCTAGVAIEWCVKTAGVTNVCGEYSTTRIAHIYERPSLELTVINSEGKTLNMPIYYEVDNSSGEYVLTTTALTNVIEGGVIENVHTTTGEKVYLGTMSDGTEVYYTRAEVTSITSFPIRISALAGPNTQAPIGYHLTITANESYETTDNTGNTKIINAGTQVYSKYYDINSKLEIELSAGDLSLENNVEYTITCSVSMNSGLSTESTVPFTVNWANVIYTPNASIGINVDTLSAYIRPYCAVYEWVTYKVTKSINTYTVTEEIIADGVYGTEVPNALTSTGEQIYWGTTANGENTYYCTIEKVTYIEDILLSVYRREFDGTFTEIATNIDGAKNTTVTDPHPALDYARYRIVAVSKTTGSVGYYDTQGQAVGEKSIVIQWDEQWSSFDTYGVEDNRDQPPWSGSLLKLPYNIDVSDKHSPDIALIEYIGRSHPVSYYGTQRGETSTWNVEIEKSDKDTLYALRRLAKWAGDVYVREPSGSGYWASITVSFSQKHRELIIPVTIEVTRVEGGV